MEANLSDRMVLGDFWSSSMQISGTGAIVGAGIGAISRSAVVLLNLGDGVPLVFVLP